MIKNPKATAKQTTQTTPTATAATAATTPQTPKPTPPKKEYGAECWFNTECESKKCFVHLGMGERILQSALLLVEFYVK